ncbi:hypothetical protein EES39_13530 [Streptomyces sp. ADI92-24]|nr:hypothetical protein EDD95_1322 [Streptomyces sp. CEV 2-1]RPK46247.1 hypothetical protein EES39_13530 [Streptomyces sp. ADI92-24]
MSIHTRELSLYTARTNQSTKFRSPRNRPIARALRTLTY